MNPNVKDIPGYGVDADPRSRPGFPKEEFPEQLRGDAQGTPVRQQSDVTVFKHGQPARKMPPVFGTAQPPKGVSGALRRLAYKYPDHWTRHWMMLLMADRVDVAEHKLRRGLPRLAAAAAVVFAGGVLARQLRG
ncbi:hypothetical protein [Comamonas sp. JC664]|uniref:hypothetical protein n=1 Tax=Comamonas sp. JC664 TaxID=2801917 RepID=UPI00191D66D7|nr:hypothetical protein [Comamonas sp. JC664]MBL0694891.1 hypothetical protein [Comamonas sp. JC664]GHG95098.1 hypothetical protein GCM10012319_58680 [Comamonas sp. KCTC 72670]